MARLERLREAVVDAGIIPRKEGKTGLPTEVYYLKVAELAALLETPEKAAEFIEIAKARSRKRRRKKYLKEKALDPLFETPGGHSARLREVFPPGVLVSCLGWFTRQKRFISETGFARAVKGYVFEVDGRLIAVTESEAERVHLEFRIPLVDFHYRGDDLQTILNESEDRIYRGIMDNA